MKRWTSKEGLVRYNSSRLFSQPSASAEQRSRKLLIPAKHDSPTKVRTLKKCAKRRVPLMVNQVMADQGWEETDLDRSHLRYVYGSVLSDHMQPWLERKTRPLTMNDKAFVYSQARTSTTQHLRWMTENVNPVEELGLVDRLDTRDEAIYGPGGRTYENLAKRILCREHFDRIMNDLSTSREQHKGHEPEFEAIRLNRSPETALRKFIDAHRPDFFTHYTYSLSLSERDELSSKMITSTFKSNPEVDKRYGVQRSL